MLGQSALGISSVTSTGEAVTDRLQTLGIGALRAPVHGDLGFRLEAAHFRMPVSSGARQVPRLIISKPTTSLWKR
jgi:hypothetical protein